MGGLEAAVLLGRDAARVIGQRWWCVLGVEQQIIQIHYHRYPLAPGFGDQGDNGGFRFEPLDQQALYALQPRDQAVGVVELLELLAFQELGLAAECLQLLLFLFHPVEPALR